MSFWVGGEKERKEIRRGANLIHFPWSVCVCVCVCSSVARLCVWCRHTSGHEQVGAPVGRICAGRKRRWTRNLRTRDLALLHLSPCRVYHKPRTAAVTVADVFMPPSLLKYRNGFQGSCDRMILLLMRCHSNSYGNGNGRSDNAPERRKHEHHSVCYLIFTSCKGLRGLSERRKMPATR